MDPIFVNNDVCSLPASFQCLEMNEKKGKRFIENSIETSKRCCIYVIINSFLYLVRQCHIPFFNVAVQFRTKQLEPEALLSTLITNCRDDSLLRRNTVKIRKKNLIMSDVSTSQFRLQRHLRYMLLKLVKICV